MPRPQRNAAKKRPNLKEDSLEFLDDAPAAAPQPKSKKVKLRAGDTDDEAYEEAAAPAAAVDDSAVTDTSAAVSAVAVAAVDQDSDYDGDESKKTTKGKKKGINHGGWRFPKHKTDKSLFLELPIELLDLILSQDGLNLRDHVALSGVNRALRQAYANKDDELWQALRDHRPVRAATHTFYHWQPQPIKAPKCINTIMSSATAENKPLFKQVPVYAHMSRADRRALIANPDANPPNTELEAVRGAVWSAAVSTLDVDRLNQTDAMDTYKVTKNELAVLSFTTRSNPYGSHPIKLFRVAAVESLALRLHSNKFNNGPVGHAQHIVDLEAKKTKLRETKIKNGTFKSPKPRHAPLPKYMRGHMAYADLYLMDYY